MNVVTDICQVKVHLLPHLVPAGELRGATAVVADVLRATTTMISALAAGCTDIRLCSTVEEARKYSGSLPAGRALLGGERDNVKIEGFDLGISPMEYTPKVCQGKTLVMTTTNGTRALLRAAEAERVLVAGFVNLSAVCEELLHDPRPIHILCAGTDGAVTLEDTLLAGALVDYLCTQLDGRLNDSARLAWDTFKQRRSRLLSALDVSDGARALLRLGHDGDIEVAGDINRFYLAPELHRDPLRVAVKASTTERSHLRNHRFLAVHT